MANFLTEIRSESDGKSKFSHNFRRKDFHQKPHWKFNFPLDSDVISVRQGLMTPSGALYVAFSVGVWLHFFSE